MVLHSEQMDAAVLGNRLPEVAQTRFLGPGSLSLQSRIESARKCLWGEHFVRCCHSTHSLGSSGVARGGQQQFATQTLRVHLLSIELQLQQKCLHPLKNVFGIYLIYITLNITLKMFWEFIS